MFQNEANVMKMDRSDASLFCGVKCKSIASVVAKKNVSKMQDYEKQISVFLWTNKFNGEHTMSLQV